MPTFGGEDIFGRAVRMAARRNEAERIRTAVPGMNGIYKCFLGTRGYRIDVDGVLTADTESDLESVISAFEDYVDGTLRDLEDNKGNTWENAELLSVETGEYRHGTDVGYTVTYHAIFEVSE